MEDQNLPLIATLGMSMGAAWVSGVRLYACVATLGWLANLHWVTLPGNMMVVAHPVVTWIATALFDVEFFADKIAWLDTGWHTVHTFIAIPAGAILASTAFTHYQPWVVVVAFMVGGGVAATAHAGKMTTRAVLNMSPEPVSNIVASAVGDVSAPIILAASIWLPVVGIVIVATLCILTFLVARKLIKSKSLQVTQAEPESV